MFLKRFKDARRAGVPIIGVETADPAATIDGIKAAYKDIPLIQWDIIRGLSAVNVAGDSVVKSLCGEEEVPDKPGELRPVDPALVSGNPSTMLAMLEKASDKTIVFMHQADALLNASDSAGVVLPVSQGIWNLRDIFKSKAATLVLMGPALMLPTCLKNDVMVIDEPLPGIIEIENTIKRVAEDLNKSSKNAKITLDEVSTTRYAKTLLGVSAFAAEQSFATSCYKEGVAFKVDETALWERKCKIAEQTQGLSIYRGKETYSDVIGYDNAKEFLNKIMNGPDAAEVYIFIDEIEKQLAGFASDLSGVSGEMMAKMLTWMQMQEALGVLLIGAGGTGKSLVGLSTGNAAKKPTVIFDLSSMKGSLVGQSISNLGNAQKMVNGIAGGGRIMIIGTCNRFGSLPPELKRRFSLGTFFFDLPTGDERGGLWKYYHKRFGLEKKQIEKIDDDGWTGAEIKNCCNIAWRLKCGIADASKYVVPISVSAADEIEKLRVMAEGKFISASDPGIYKRSKTAVSSLSSALGRRFGLGEDN